MRALALLCFVLSLVGSALAQQKMEDRASWLFPPDNELLAAAQLGFVGKDDIPLKQVYERAGASLTLPERMTSCRDKVELVQVAGPRTLAALRGRIAQKQAATGPKEDWILESRGEVLLSIEFYARKEHEDAEASLWQDSHEYRPVWQHVIQTQSIRCDFVDVPVGKSAGIGGQNRQSRHIVQQWYILRFAPETAAPNWDKSFKFSIRRADGQAEEFELTLGVPLEQQAKEMH
jgi:hypothetical protein